MDLRPLGRNGPLITPIGYGAFKIGRNWGIRYPQQYELPTEAEVDRLLNGVLDVGINYIDTAPAYGLSEERIGQAISHRRDEFVLSTKVGETSEDGKSVHDFSAQAIRASVKRSLGRLRTDVLDLVFIHSDGRDLEILRDTDAVPTLDRLSEEGLIRGFGLSGKTVEGARSALPWADAIMVEYNLDDTSHAEVMIEAQAAGVGVVVKKGLASGHLPAAEAIRFVLRNEAACSLVIGGLSLHHIRENLEVAQTL